jgi:hypothetical protein
VIAKLASLRRDHRPMRDQPARIAATPGGCGISQLLHPQLGCAPETRAIPAATQRTPSAKERSIQAAKPTPVLSQRISAAFRPFRRLKGCKLGLSSSGCKNAGFSTGLGSSRGPRRQSERPTALLRPANRGLGAKRSSALGKQKVKSFISKNLNLIQNQFHRPHLLA